MNKKPVVIDLFCGAGGFSEGFNMAGYDVRLAIDINEDALKTHKVNHPTCSHLLGNIEDVETEEALSLASLKKDDVDGIIGGPPCQGFSILGKRGREKNEDTGEWRFINDPRNFLYKEFVRFARDIHPKFFVMENVTGMLSFLKPKLSNKVIQKIKNREIDDSIIKILKEQNISQRLINKVINEEIDEVLLEQIQDSIIVQQVIEDFEKLSYDVSYKIINAAEYGVPQKRRRLIFVGRRKDLKKLYSFPEATHGDNLLVKNKIPYETVKNALSDLPSLSVNKGSEEMEYDKETDSLYQKFMRCEIDYDTYIRKSKASSK